MNLTEKDIEKISNLAKLNAGVDLEDLNNILHFIEQIQNIDTNNVEPMYHSRDLNQRLDNDEVREKNVKEDMQKIAPEAESGYYLVPQVIEEN